jgi:hypothetical protein
MDHYAALGISPSADREAILAAYRARVADLTAQSHRATTAEARLDAERRLHEVEAAYHVLGDPARRTAYDLKPARPRRIAVARGSEREAPPEPEPQIRSVQWVQEPAALPLPTTAPPAEHPEPSSAPLPKGPRKGPEGSEPLRVPLPTTAPPVAPRDWRWIAVIAAAGLAAFLAAMAIVTSGFEPVRVGPVLGGSPAPMPTTETPATTSQAPAAPAPIAEAPTAAPVAAVPAAAVPSGPVGSRYTQYTNQAQGISFVYPEDVLTPLGGSADGGSQTFASADGRTVVAVSAQPNTAGTSLADAYAQAARKDVGREVTYTASGSRWYVVSGYEGDTLFYEKVVLGDGAFKSLRITFPRAYRAAHYDMVEAMSNSFKSVN